MRLVGWFVCCIGFVAIAGSASTQSPSVAELLAHGQQISSRYGNHVWSGFSQTPFPVLLLERKGERLFCPHSKPAGFRYVGLSAATDCRVYHRAENNFAKHMQATFVFAGRFPVVVIGEPDLSEGNHGAWLATLLHEHFHQYQMSWPGYAKALDDLNLKKGDEADSWALSYPFAYEDIRTGNLLRLLSQQLAEILTEPDRDIAVEKTHVYARLRPLVLSQLPEGQMRFLEFQLWQEGVARYTELAMAEFASHDTGSKQNTQIDFASLAANLRKDMVQNLVQSDLAQHQRAYFYSFGAAEALILDLVDSNWRQRYFEQSVSMAGFFADITKNQ